MTIVNIFATIGWLALSFFLTRMCLRWFLGPLYEAARNSRKPTQYSIGDIYLLIGQIALATLPTALVPMSDGDRAWTFISVALFLGLSWFLCCRMLARNRIRKFKPRLLSMLLFHAQLGLAIFYGFGLLPMLIVLFLSLPFGLLLGVVFYVALMLLRHASNAIYNQREEDPETLTQLAARVRLSDDVVSHVEFPEQDSERKTSPPPGPN